MQLSLLWTNNAIGSSTKIFSTPAMEDGRAYLANFFGHVFCVSLSDGQIIWQFKASSAIHADIIIANENVIVSCTNGFIYALNKSNGSVIWKCLTSGRISWAPVGQNELIYIGTQAGDICCIDSRDGSELWTYHAEKSIFGRPTISGNYLVFGSGNFTPCDYIYCIDIVSRQVMWRQKTSHILCTSPVIRGIDNERDEKVFIGVWNEMWCMDLATGLVDWSFQTDGEIGMTPSVGRLGVIFGNSLGRKVYSLDRRTGEVQWKASTKGDGYSLLVYENSVLFLARKEHRLYCFDGLQGRCEWKREIRSEVSRMNISDKYLLLAGSGKSVYCFEIIPDEPGN